MGCPQLGLLTGESRISGPSVTPFAPFEAHSLPQYGQLQTAHDKRCLRNYKRIIEKVCSYPSGFPGAMSEPGMFLLYLWRVPAHLGRLTQPRPVFLYSFMAVAGWRSPLLTHQPS